MKHRGGLALILAGLVASAPLASAYAGTEACTVPSDLALTNLALPVAAKAVATRHQLTIVALGGASTIGAAARGAQYSYPARLEALLRARLPDIQVGVVNRGSSSRSVSDRIDQIDADLAGTHPDLVIWAPGSTEAGIAEDPDLFQSVLAQGAARIRATGADLVMIDLQYTPHIARAINLLPYNAAIARIAGQQNAGLLRRTDLMRRWQEAGALRLDGIPHRNRVTAIRILFNCVAMALADGIVPAMRPAP